MSIFFEIFTLIFDSLTKQDYCKNKAIKTIYQQIALISLNLTWRLKSHELVVSQTQNHFLTVHILAITVLIHPQ